MKKCLLYALRCMVLWIFALSLPTSASMEIHKLVAQPSDRKLLFTDFLSLLKGDLTLTPESLLMMGVVIIALAVIERKHHAP